MRRDEDTSVNSKLSAIYYNPHQPGSLGGVEKFYSRVRRLHPSIDKKQVIDWLSGQDAYTLHKPTKERFRRRPTIVSGVGDQMQADLMDTRSHADHNDGIHFILTAIDCFSRKAWVKPTRSKSGDEVSAALDEIFSEHSFNRLQTDKGKEFYNAKVSKILQKHGVEHFSTENETIKASIVERFNRTLRERLHRYMTGIPTNRYLDVLQDIVEGYNDTPHTATGFTPNEVDADNQSLVFDRLYESPAVIPSKRVNSPLRVDDLVRITKARGSFERGYTPNWTRELFRVTHVLDDERPVVYRLEDYGGEMIKGTFYRHELQRVKEPQSFTIERVIKTRRRKGKKQYYVKWDGYPDSFNSWVDEKDMMS